MYFKCNARYLINDRKIMITHLFLNSRDSRLNEQRMLDFRPRKDMISEKYMTRDKCVSCEYAHWYKTFIACSSASDSLTLYVKINTVEGRFYRDNFIWSTSLLSFSVYFTQAEDTSNLTIKIGGVNFERQKLILYGKLKEFH